MLRSHLLTSTKQNGIITPLDLMAVFFLVQPSVWFASHSKSVLLACMCVVTHCYSRFFSAELPVCFQPMPVCRHACSVLKQPL